MFVWTVSGPCTCTAITTDAYNCTCDECPSLYVIGGKYQLNHPEAPITLDQSANLFPSFPLSSSIPLSPFVQTFLASVSSSATSMGMGMTCNGNYLNGNGNYLYSRGNLFSHIFCWTLNPESTNSLLFLHSNMKKSCDTDLSDWTDSGILLRFA